MEESSESENPRKIWHKSEFSLISKLSGILSLSISLSKKLFP